jgi:hypothetical protein
MPLGFPEPDFLGHGRDWWKDEDAFQLQIGGRVPRKVWNILSKSGETFFSGCDETRVFSRLEYFLLLFPKKQLQEMSHNTNNKFIALKKM